MNDLFYEDKIVQLTQKHKNVSVTLIQFKFKLQLAEAQRLHAKYVKPRIFIDNFSQEELQTTKTLIKKHACKAVSVPYLQKRLGLDFDETTAILAEWRALKKESDIYKKKFDEIRKYLKPPKFKPSKEDETDYQRRKERRTINAINHLESLGYKVEKL